MPYITQERRDALDTEPVAEDAGELNYLFTQALKRGPDRAFMIAEAMDAYVEQWGESYHVYNDILGALFGASLERTRRTGDLEHMPMMSFLISEFYNLQVARYEDEKIAENGDVY